MLNIRSASIPGDRGVVSDRTARTRIRDAAIELFGAKGFAATSVRDVASAAGVSAGLVMHHFDGKAGLRVECDDRVVQFVLAKSSGAAAVDTIAGVGEYGPYLARMITDGTDAGMALFVRLVDDAETVVTQAVADHRMRDLGDTRAVALVLTVQSLAPLLLQAQRAHDAGRASPPPTPATYAGLAAEIYTRGIFTTDEIVAAVGGTSET